MKLQPYAIGKTSKTLTVYVVRRLWKVKHYGKDEIFFTTKHVKNGPWKQKLLFTMLIPRGTEYVKTIDSAGIIEHTFRFTKNIDIPVWIGDKR